MAVWEYKVISSGKGGFATPALLESFLNQLGTDEWEIVEFRGQPDNPLAFSGLARRPTQRDWTLEDAAAAAARQGAGAGRPPARRASSGRKGRKGRKPKRIRPPRPRRFPLVRRSSTRSAPTCARTAASRVVRAA